jgi:regulatory protein YycI of two-component signal transduction system YycFG
MERSLLKNIIILILVLVNMALLLSLGIRSSEERSARSRTAEELTELFARDGVTLNADGIPADKTPAVEVLQRDTAADRNLAAFLLGDDLSVSDEGGGICTYTGDGGQAVFRSGGSFGITGRLGDRSIESLCRKFCKTYGYRNLSVSFDEDGRNGTVTAVQYYNNHPVENASVTFLARNGCLISVSGTYLPDSAASSDTACSMTAATALTKFLDARRESGAVVTAVSDVYLCYELQSTAAAPLVLVPAWCVVTDTVQYYVNCSTGAVTHG